MEDLLEDEGTRAERPLRRKVGKVLGVMGLALLFGGALAMALVPGVDLLPLVGVLAVGTVILVVSYLAVR